MKCIQFVACINVKDFAIIQSEFTFFFGIFFYYFSAQNVF